MTQTWNPPIYMTVTEPLMCSQGGIPYNKAHLDARNAEIARLRSENERLHLRNAALVEALKDHRCPADYRVTVADCQQCGCLDGLLIQPLSPEPPK